MKLTNHQILQIYIIQLKNFLFGLPLPRLQYLISTWNHLYIQERSCQELLYNLEKAMYIFKQEQDFYQYGILQKVILLINYTMTHIKVLQFHLYIEESKIN